MNLLIVEDDEKQLQMYNDVIDSFSKKNSIEIERACFSTLESGMEAINNNFFDAAIIDLKLSSNSDKLEGMDLVNAINGKLRIPIYIVSGSIAQVEIEENTLLKKKLRTEDFRVILSEIKAIYDTGITNFLKPGGQIDQMLSDIFWNHLSKDLDIWIKHNNQDTLIRYILSHFQEYLDIDSVGDFREYHPSEVYIIPKIKKNSHTGDLIRFDGELYLILTPACDMVFNYKMENNIKTPFRKAQSMLVAPVIDFDYQKLCLNSKNVIDKNKVIEFVKNGNYRYHYLPPYINLNGYVIDFQKLRSIGFEEVIETIANISSHFIKDIISRFSNYYSRQGQPTFDQNKIVDELMSRVLIQKSEVAKSKANHF